MTRACIRTAVLTMRSCDTNYRMAGALPQDQVRIADAERDQAEERLRQAHVEGSLDLAEFDQRAARLWQETKTRADLAAGFGRRGR